MNHFQLGLAALMLTFTAAVSAAENVKQVTFDVQFRVVDSCQVESSGARIEAQCTGVRPLVVRSSQVAEASGAPSASTERDVLVYF